MLECLRCAGYCAFLTSYCQGLELIARASIDEDWNISLSHRFRTWRAGCIIQSEFIADLFEPVLKEDKTFNNTKLIDCRSGAAAQLLGTQLHCFSRDCGRPLYACPLCYS
ncbi:hypothetical protein GGI42DRAFT_316042 [Trichoderma sp. SZMC 28013]